MPLTTPRLLPALLLSLLPLAPTMGNATIHTPATMARSSATRLQGVSAHTATRSAAVQTLTLLEPGAPDTLNPLLTRTSAGLDATAGVFDSLVRLDAVGTFRPDLATHWRRSVDARTWVFSLDPRARWQDGEHVTAADVAFTLRLVRDARFGALSTRGFDHIAGVAIGDTWTLTITLTAAYAPFLATVGTTPMLPAHVFASLSPRQIRDYAPFNRHPIGSGPFTVAEMTVNGTVIEEANADYFGGPPRLDRLIFSPAGTVSRALGTAHHDDNVVLPPSLDLTPAQAAPFTGTQPLRALYSPSFAWTHLDLIEHGALADARVRRALALATPRESIITRVLAGHGRLCDGDQAPATPAYDPSLYDAYPYDPGAARKLLYQAGYVALPGGLVGLAGVPLSITLWGDAGCASCATTLDLIAQSWRAAGISSTVQLVATATLFGPRGPLYDPARFHAPRYDAVLYTWINGPDPNDALYWTRKAIVSAAHPLGGNFDGYANPKLDALESRALITPNGPGRDALYRRIQRILSADEPDIFLYWPDAISIAPRRLQGYAPTPYNAAATWNVATWQMH